VQRWRWMVDRWARPGSTCLGLVSHAMPDERLPLRVCRTTVRFLARSGAEQLCGGDGKTNACHETVNAESSLLAGRVPATAE
jgi:hypothetical protein